MLGLGFRVNSFGLGLGFWLGFRFSIGFRVCDLGFVFYNL